MLNQVQQLRQRAKQQREAGQGSRESVEAQREDEVILALKKKYEDLLQYVLKVVLALVVCILGRRQTHFSLCFEKTEISISITMSFLCHFPLFL